ncbi:MAG TPA: hypothetical protein VFC63_28110 [Blastocatellia bacterium]|nr:hypothetical protein [Blastocatellia bacterium]
MKRRLITVLIFAFLLILMVSGAVMVSAQGQSVEEIHRSFPISSDGRISLENINGRVQIKGWDRNEVKIDAVKRANREERLREVDVQITADSNSVRIKTKYSSNNLVWSDNAYCEDCNPASVDFTLMVPRGVRIDKIAVVNSPIDIEDLTGFVDASSVNGHLRATKLYGQTRLSTVNGRLEADFAVLRESQRVSLGSVNGSVALTLPFAANAEISASTVHGGISNDFGFEATDGRYVGHSLSGVLGDGSSRITLNNVNGSISIHREGNSSQSNLSQNKRKASTIKSTRSLSADEEFIQKGMPSRTEKSWESINTKIARIDKQRSTVDGQISSIDNLRGVLEQQWNVSPEEKRAMDAERSVLDAEKEALTAVKRMLDKQKSSLEADLVALEAKSKEERESKAEFKYTFRQR